MLLFSFSLFGLALTGITWLGIVTPFGGACLLIGWAALGAYALGSPLASDDATFNYDVQRAAMLMPPGCEVYT
jgi:hypothetical protein